MPDRFNRNKLQGSAILFALAVFSLLFAGCAAVDSAKVSPRVSLVDFERIAVLPVQRVLPDDPREHFVRCPLTGAFQRTCGEPLIHAERDLEELFLSALRERRQYILVPPERVEGVLLRVRSASFKETVPDQLRQVGRELDADGVIAGYVFCYRERQGYTYAAEQPASVVFGFHLYDVANDVVIWSGTFDKTQESLMGNVLDIRTFFRGGGKWLAVRELAAQGMQELMKTFPERE